MFKTTPYISIIIPIYNVIRFIDRGIAQLLSQSYTNFEIILIDDGSTDGSGEKCDNYAKKDSRIRVFHQQNSGSGVARNLGILNAHGKYIWFYDVDDTIAPNLLDKCINNLSEDTEVLIFGYIEVNRQFNTRRTFKFKNHTYYSNQEIRDDYIEELSGLKFNNGFVWNKIYNRQFLVDNNILFKNLLIQQDEVFNLVVYRYANNITTLHDDLYTYHIYNVGNTRSNFIQNRFEIYCTVHQHFIDLYNYWNLNSNKFLIYLYTRLLTAIITCLTYNCYHKNTKFNRQERLDYICSILNSEKTTKCIKQLDVLGYKPRQRFTKKYYKYIINKSYTKFRYIWIIENLFINLKLLYHKFIK